jgi:hypothetical protein
LLPDILISGDRNNWYTCDRHLRRIGFAVLQYEIDHNGKLPDADRWVDELYPYIKDWSVFRCPADTTAGRCSYAMNERLSGKRADNFKQPDTVLIYETSHAGMNPHGDGSDLINPPRHPYPKPGATYRFNGFVFADSGVRFPETAEEESLYHW